MTKMDSSYVSARGDIPIIQVPDESTITQASNQASSGTVAAVAFAVVFIIALSIGFAGVGLLRWDAQTSFIVSVIVAISGSIMTLVIVNGDLVGLMEVFHRYGSRNHLISAQKDIAVEFFAYQSLAEKNRSREALALIEAQNTSRQEVSERAYILQQLVDVQRRLSVDSTPPKDTFVQATCDDARTACRAWAQKQWDRDGKPTFEHGKWLMPWNSEWGGKPWKQEAKNLLIDCGVVRLAGSIYVPGEGVSCRLDALNRLWVALPRDEKDHRLNS